MAHPERLQPLFAQQILYKNLLRAGWETLQFKGLWNGIDTDGAWRFTKSPCQRVSATKESSVLRIYYKSFIDVTILPETGFLRNQYFKIIIEIQYNSL